MIEFKTANFCIKQVGDVNRNKAQWYMAWTFDGNNPDYLCFMAKVLNGYLF